MSNVMLKLEEIRKLKADWDSYGAQPINYYAINLAKWIMQAGLPGTWVAVPGSDGSVQLEQHEHGRDIEICIAVSASDGAK